MEFLLTDEEMEEELLIQKKHGINDIVVLSKLGSTILSKILQSKGFCRLCNKDFVEILGDDNDLAHKIIHAQEHFEEDFRSTREEMERYFK